MLNRFGHTMYHNDEGNLCILCEPETANIEELFINACLADINEKYKIIESRDFFWSDSFEDVDIEFVTNLPYETFDKLTRKDRTK